MTLSVDLHVPGRLSAAFSAEPGEVLAVVGPNGAGKTTLLRALAGVAAARGEATLDGRDLLGLPPDRRGVGWLPQSSTLFPHLSVLGNVAYGLRAGGQRRGAAHRRALTALAQLGVEDLAGRRPASLSGGQAQKVALARALVVGPGLVLLDEPLASLDATARDDVRRVLRAALRGGPAVVLLVTHDAVDVATVADRVLVLERGLVMQDAQVGDVLRAPRSPWVARLLGLNAWRGTAEGEHIRVDDGGVITPPEPVAAGATVLVLVAPSAVALHRSRPHGSPRNVVSGPVESTTSLAGRVRVTLASTPRVTAEITGASAAELDLAGGGELWASFKATEVTVVVDQVQLAGVQPARDG